MVRARVIAGRVLKRSMTPVATMVMVVQSVKPSLLAMAARNEPGPLSLVFVTVQSAARATGAAARAGASRASASRHASATREARGQATTGRQFVDMSYSLSGERLGN